MDDNVKYITTTEAARRLDLGARTVLRMCEDGRIAATRPSGSRYKILDTEIERLLRLVVEKE